MVAYPLAPRRAKNKSRRKGDSLRPGAAGGPAWGRPPMAWWEDAHFPARARRAALPRPGRPNNHLQENLRILPPLSHFGGSIAQKRRAVKKNRGPGGAGMQTGGLTTRLRAPAGTPPRAACRPPLHTMGKVQIYSAGAYSAEGSPAGSRPRPTNRRKRHIVLQTFRQVVGAACMPPGRRSCGNAVLRADSPFSDVP